MGRRELVYRAYIYTTPSQLWDALVSPEKTRAYWGAELITDWRVGSAIEWHYAGATIFDPGSVVVAFDPCHRLAYTWHITTPEFAAAVGMGPGMQQRLAAESRSTVTFELEPFDDMVKLTLTQNGFDPDSAKLASLTESWPRIVSQLKTYLERLPAPVQSQDGPV